MNTFLFLLVSQIYTECPVSKCTLGNDSVFQDKEIILNIFFSENAYFFK